MRLPGDHLNMLQLSHLIYPQVIMSVLSVQNVLSGSGRAGGLRFKGKYIDHRLVARPELDSTFWTDSTEDRRDIRLQRKRKKET